MGNIFRVQKMADGEGLDGGHSNQTTAHFSSDQA